MNKLLGIYKCIGCGLTYYNKKVKCDNKGVEELKQHLGIHYEGNIYLSLKYGMDRYRTTRKTNEIY
jgi:hypothetical protein